MCFVICIVLPSVYSLKSMLSKVYYVRCPAFRFVGMKIPSSVVFSSTASSMMMTSEHHGSWSCYQADSRVSPSLCFWFPWECVVLSQCVLGSRLQKLWSWHPEQDLECAHAHLETHEPAHQHSSLGRHLSSATQCRYTASVFTLLEALEYEISISRFPSDHLHVYTISSKITHLLDSVLHTNLG